MRAPLQTVATNQTSLTRIWSRTTRLPRVGTSAFRMVFSPSRWTTTFTRDSKLQTLSRTATQIGSKSLECTPRTWTTTLLNPSSLLTRRVCTPRLRAFKRGLARLAKTRWSIRFTSNRMLWRSTRPSSKMFTSKFKTNKEPSRPSSLKISSNTRRVFLRRSSLLKSTPNYWLLRKSVMLFTNRWN